MRAVRKVIHPTEHDEDVLSQSNAKNKDGNFWCGRTSASIVYNYYARLGSVPGPIKNQSDKAPYQLVYPDGSYAALTAAGQCAPGETFERLERKGLGHWEYVPLFPPDKRNSPPDIESIFGQLLDHLDRNNPAFFASGFSENLEYASHFITITGYHFRDGLWLQITDPATNHHVVKDLIVRSGGTQAEAERMVRVESLGQWAPLGSTVKPFGSRYWVHQDVFFRPNTKLKGHPKFLEKGITDPLLCDNSYTPGFGVMIVKAGLATPDTYAETEHAAGWPIEVAREATPPRTAILNGSAPIQQFTVEQRGEWKGLLDRTGSFPVGTSLTWHGGVHVLAQQAVGRQIYCMAPGEIVLARFPDESQGDARPRRSNGFILVRHRIDTKRRAFLDVAARSDHALELYSLYMHTGPLGAFLGPDGAPSREIVLQQGAPRWLGALCPRPLPKRRTYLPATAQRAFSVQNDVAAADAEDGGFSALPPSPTEERRVGADLDVVEVGGDDIEIAGAKSSIVKVDGARHAALGSGPVSNDLLGTKAFKIFEPTASGKLHYFNPLTGQLIKVAVDVPKGTGVIVESEPAPRVTPLIKRDGQSFVRVVHDKPAMFDHKPGMNEGDKLRVCKDPVRVVLGSGADAVKSDELAASSHPLFFDFAGGQPRLVPVVNTTRQQLAIWQATAKKQRPVTVPAAAVQTVFNPVTDELIAVPGLGGADRALATGRNNSLRSMEIGGKVYVEVAGVDVALEPSPDDSAAQQLVVFFENDVASIDLFARSGGEDDRRFFVPESRFQIKNADALLAFRYDESDRASTGTEKRDRIWLDLVPCVGVPDAQVGAWNDELGKLERSRMGKLQDRVKRGLTRLMGVKFSDKSGWKLDKAGDEDVIKAADLPSDKARMFCETEVQSGWIALREVKADKGPSPWEVAFDASGSIHPAYILKTDQGVAYGAVFELLISTPYELANNDADIDAAKAENDARATKVADEYRRGAIIAPGTPVKVGREPVAGFDTSPDAFAHVEIFAASNAVDPDAPGTDGKIERIQQTLFAVLLDQDSRDDYAPEFVATLLKQLEKGDIHLDMGALAAASAAGGIVKPAEWGEFCQTNAGKLSFLVTAHASEWHPDQTKVLDEARRRGRHLHPDEVDAQKDEIKRFAFLDQLSQSPPWTGALYHVHPFRFLEWILTGFDVTVRNAPSAALALESWGTTTDLTKDAAGEGMPAAKGADDSTVHRVRAVVGGDIPAVPAVLVLKSGFTTSNSRLPVLLKRGNTATPTVVNPRATARLESDSHGDLDTAVAVQIRGVKDGFLLADGGLLPDHQFSYARVVLEVEYNWAAPKKIVAKLTNASAFKLRAQDTAVKLDADAKQATLVPPQLDDAGRFFTGAQRLTMTLDVLAKDVAGAGTQVAFTVEGSDFPSNPTPQSPSITTRDKFGSDDPGGEDVAKLQLYLSQIPSSDDGRPCYRWSGADDDRKDVAYGANKKVVVDGRYKIGLARALWRFLYSYAPENTFSVDTVALTAKKQNKVDRNAPPPPTSVTRDELRSAAGAAKKAARTGADCTELPVVNKALVAEILDHMKPPYVIPKVHLGVEATTGAVRVDKLPNVKILEDWKKTEIAKSAILPVNDDSITLVVDASQMKSFGGDLKVALEVQSGGAYRFDGGATTKTITLHGASPTAKVPLRYSGNLDSKPANNVVNAKAKVVAGVDVDVALGSIQLFGARDLCAQGKDGVAKRDAALVQALLANAHDANNVPYYHPPSKKTEIEADGRWGDGARKSLTTFAGSTTGAAAITNLLATQPK
jgi:hypothetical protein